MFSGDVVELTFALRDSSARQVSARLAQTEPDCGHDCSKTNRSATDVMVIRNSSESGSQSEEML